MANEEHLRILWQGVRAWNKWREDNPSITPDLSSTNLSESKLSGANLSKATLRGADLWGADLTGADLTGADLYRAYLAMAHLTNADLFGADLGQANLTIAKLIEANLTTADLTTANLSSADLSKANLSGAWLSYATLNRAELNGTILNQANLNRTVLTDLDLRSAIGLDTVEHRGPSSLGIDTLYRSNGEIPEVFLRGVGLPNDFIQYIPSLVGQPIQFYSCFISYSHKDKAFAKRLYDALQGRGIRCWLDEHQLLPGDKLHVAIDRGIRLWDKVLLCCSKDALNSWWVENEVNLAIQKEQRLHKERGQEVLSLIPLNLDDYMFSEEWHSGWKGQITSRLAPNFTGWQRSHKKFEAQLEQVVKALRADAGARGMVPPSRL